MDKSCQNILQKFPKSIYKKRIRTEERMMPDVDSEKESHPIPGGGRCVQLKLPFPYVHSHVSFNIHNTLS